MNLDALLRRFAGSIREPESFRGETTLTADREALVPLGRVLRDEPGLAFRFLSDLCGVDLHPAVPRFRVVYHLFSPVTGNRLRLKVPLGEQDPVVDSVTGIWETADWHERECYDLFGIRFRGHPDLRRILLPDHFEGHPLRKDFPLEGVKNP
ncbi:MAG TPA: NADH-quinone oxidoreductase subunit C [Syntrophales bacterium]|nr:NADH-quinone oxidoreductase subunit C [Syntrophales bacterium]HPX11758.1 NADH-quinone oxidoreductase subunit C [Syntrophales bacterium]HQB29258.1 NADH-quinone oxidoreductase subunit C [Syntrophales bacterium]HQN76763.1 NADH-quinone oxidoreductase subunit C [Syntrophales bacterium]HQQ26116.1 NADH-quinone oxidoreductase subunit C [Syntrophales bacterium]